MNEQRPCLRCLTRISEPIIHFNLECLTISLKENSIYTKNFGTKSPTSPLEHGDIDSVPDFPTFIAHLLEATSTFTTSADLVALTVEWTRPITAFSLASDISQWIMGLDAGLPASKLSLLCSPVFQRLAKDHFRDDFVKNFRLLIWATTLLNSATIQSEKLAHVRAEENLRRLVAFYGEAVISEVDRLCKYSNMRSQSSENMLLLFLVLIGLCLAASYIAPVDDNNRVG